MGLTFLSGLPTAARKRRILVPMQAWIDDSGGPDQVVQVMAGFIGRTEEWADFSEQWSACLAESPTIQTFKMRDAAGMNGEFYGMGETARDEKLKRLATVLDGFGFSGVYVSVDISGFKETFAHYSGSAPLRNPYFYGYVYVIMSATDHLLHDGQQERFELFFDEHVMLGEKVKLWYPTVRGLGRPEERAIMPLEPLSRKDDEFKPLQAADMLAWFARRETAGLAHPFQWLKPFLANTKLSPFSHVVDRERMQKTWNQFTAFRDSVTPEQIAEMRKMLGLD